MAIVEARLPNPRLLRQRAVLFIRKLFYGSLHRFRRGYRIMLIVRRHSCSIVPTGPLDIALFLLTKRFCIDPCPPVVSF